MKIFPRLDIKAPDGTVYLRRWTLLRGCGCKVMLHKMETPDYARELHDHPWPFVTIVLRGGYVERHYRESDVCHCGQAVSEHTQLDNHSALPMLEPLERWNAPGCIRFNGAEHSHVITDLPRGPCWTLVLRGRRCRPWGFWTWCKGKLAWMHWRTYTDRVYGGDPVCEDEKGVEA